jgi:hypothetical protein
MSKTNADDGEEEEEYTPAVITAGEDREVKLRFRDERTTESEHVTMPNDEESSEQE